MAFDITGKLIVKNDTVERSATFKIREFVIEISEEVNGRIITNYIKFQSVQDKTAIIDRYAIGETIKVHFNIRGNKWEKEGNTNYFTNLDAWRIEPASASNQEPQASSSNSGISGGSSFVAAAASVVAEVAPIVTDMKGADDLPF
jgi:hypothetical protein